jgi:hypothetical protein
MEGFYRVHGLEHDSVFGYEGLRGRDLFLPVRIAKGRSG